MVAAKANAIRKPVRWFSIPQLFRYERAQRGRLREHYQLNVDIVGEPSELADAELLSVAIDIMRELGLSSDDVRARVSDRRLLNAILEALGVDAVQFAAVYAVLDKIARTPANVSREKLAAVGLADAPIDRIIALAAVKGIAPLRIEFGASVGVAPHLERFERYLAHLQALGVSDWVDLDLSIVRGLAYYTGIVFELFDAKGELRAICGGGRYDTLLLSLGNVDLPALGFGMGDVVLGELLKERGLMPAKAGTPAELFVVGGEGVLDHPIGDALTLTRQLRRAGFSVDHVMSAEKYQAQSSRNQVDSAKKFGARAAIYFENADTVMVLGLAGRILDAPKGEFAAAPLLAGDVNALAALRSWFDSTISSRNID
jgi:histidyl-tRNA synthetase